MKVLLVTALVAGGVGGHVRMLAQGLVRAGHRVVVACPQEVVARFGMGGTGAVVVAVEVGASARPVQALQAVRRLRRLAAGADVVHAHGVRAGALCAVALGGRRTPLVVTTHNAPPAEGAGGATTYALLERVLHHRADLVLGVSPDLVERARSRGAAEVDLAVVPADPSGVVGQERRPEVRREIRRELGLAEGQLLLLSVGRLGAQKRMDEVVAAYQGLEGVGTGTGTLSAPRVVLAVAGDGPARESLAAQVAAGPGQVLLLGRRDDVADLLAAADVVVSGAQWEGQPLWLQEALAAGAAIVATDVGGTAVVLGDAARLVRVENNAEGALVAEGHERARSARQTRVEELRAAVQELVDDAALRADLSGRALRRARELPTPAQAVQTTVDAYARAGGTAYPDRPSPGQRP